MRQHARPAGMAMLEALIVGSTVLLLWGLTAAMSLSWETLLALGQGLAVAGLLLGVPSGLIYHLALHRALSSSAPLPPGWYWNPMAQHPRLPLQNRAGVLLWCGLGALGFAVVVLGILILAMALYRGYSLST